MPAVTVVIPARNAADTVKETLDAVIAQRFRHWEAIVVDDGSEDGTADIVSRTAGTDDRIRFIQTPWQGLPTARNTAIAQARGTYIHCLDADDAVDPDFYEAMTDALDSAPGSSRCAVSGYRQHHDDGSTGLSIQAPRAEALGFAKLARHNFGPPLCYVFDRALIQRVGAFDASLAHCHDWDLWLRFARAGATFIPVAGFLGRYAIRQGSLSRSHVRFMDSIREVLLRTARSDPRVARPAHAPLDEAAVRAGLPPLWHYSLLKAASEGNNAAMTELFQWGREHLPSGFWAAPESFGVTPGFRWAEHRGDASAAETTERERALSRLYRDNWPIALPEPLARRLST